MKKIVFLHIQKTAGNSLHQVLFNNRLGYISLRYNQAESLTKKGLDAIQRRHPFKITGIGGHQLDCTRHHAYFGDEQYTFTVLRDPVDRYISFYNHLSRRDDFNFSFDEFLAAEERNNWQTKSIARVDDAQKAIEILENNFDFVGIFEEMEKTMSVLAHDLEMDVDEDQLNISRSSVIKRSELSPSQLEKVRENHVNDYQVYEWAKGRFDRMEVEQRPKVQVSRFKRKRRRVLRKVVSFWINR